MSGVDGLIAVGVDAGGSGTVAIATRDGELLRSANGPAANAQTQGAQRAADAIERAVRGACGAAGASREAIACALLAELAVRFPGTRIAVTTDAHVALRAAVPAGDAAVLIAGTGSIAYAETSGEIHRAGGFGPLIGDEGSGCAIGAAALRLLLRVFEGRTAADGLSAEVARITGATGIPEALAYAYDAPAPAAALAALAPAVLQCAASGERSAQKIVQAAALELFDLVLAVWRMVEPDVKSGGIPLAFCGGLLSENSMLTYLLETRIANDLPQLGIVKGAAEPHFGALLEARALLKATP
jgi:N-acetylglucosamine kinase-like BadF-type ATPase